MPDEHACNLRVGDLGCTFRGTPGAITLKVEPTKGSVVFQAAQYDGQAIPNLPAKTMTFDIKSGKKDLVVVYAFSNSVDGAGILEEVCNNNTQLIGVTAREVAVVYHICA
jgi:hypothetical protein